MTCCGSTIRRSTTGGLSKEPFGRPVLFEYDGRDQLILFGRKTGIRYHFPGPGARVYVDVRDQAAFDIMSGMRIVT